MIISIGNCDFTLRFRTDRDADFHPAAFFSWRPLARGVSCFWSWNSSKFITFMVILECFVDVRGNRAIKFFAPVATVYEPC